MNKTRAQKLADLRSAGAGGLPIASSRPGDPRARRYTQTASTPFEQFSPDDFYVDSFGRISLGTITGTGISLQERRRRPQ